jgi:hypothetical protein
MKMGDNHDESRSGMIREPDCSDFDGHTEFSRLTPEQRLEWLSGLVMFVYEARKLREQRGRNESTDNKKDTG